MSPVMLSPVIITLGSNIHPEQHLVAAVREIEQSIEICKVSDVWQSAPMGDLNQPDFCNAAVLFDTALSPQELKQILRAIESKLGRVRDPTNKNAPRTIDLDIALFGEQIIQDPQLTIPDPELHQRPFLIIPASQVAPEIKHPQLGRTLLELAECCGGTDQLRRRDEIKLG